MINSKNIEATLGKAAEKLKNSSLIEIEDFPGTEIDLVIGLAPKIIKTKGIEEFEKIVDKVYQILQDGKGTYEFQGTDHHGIPIGEPITCTHYTKDTHQKIRDHIDEVTDQIRQATCNARLEIGVEIKKEKTSSILDEIRDWESKETARKSDFPSLEVVLIIEGKVRVPIDNVRFYSYPKKFEMYGKTDHLDLVAPQWPKTKEISGFICRGVSGRCDSVCEYHTEHNKKD